MRRYALDDYAYYGVEFFNDLGAAVIPDWDASLYWEFRDSAGVLQFTATTSSTPALTDRTTYVDVSNIPLTGWATGIATVRIYAKLAGVNFDPYPLVASAFEVVDAGSLVDQLRYLLHLDDTSEDDFLLLLIQSAANWAENYLARSLLTQERVKQVQAPVGRGLSVSSLKYPTILLTYPPVQSVDRVYTVTDKGVETDITDYWLDDKSIPPELHLNSLYWSNKLRVEYTTGYGATYASLPEAIRRGILMHAAYLYKYRGDCPIAQAAETSGAIGEYRIYKVVRRG